MLNSKENSCITVSTVKDIHNSKGKSNLAVRKACQKKIVMPSKKDKVLLVEKGKFFPKKSHANCNSKEKECIIVRKSHA